MFSPVQTSLNRFMMFFAITKQRVISESGCAARAVFAGANEFGPVLMFFAIAKQRVMSESGCKSRDVFAVVIPVPGCNLASALCQTHFLPAGEFG